MSKERTGCEARQFSDQMMCGRCGLQWDMNDDDPPTCPKNRSLGGLVTDEMVSDSPERARRPVDPLRDGPPISVQPRDDDPLAQARAILGDDDVK